MVSKAQHRNTAIGKENRALILMALEDGPLSTEEIAQLIGLGYAQVTRHVALLRLSDPKPLYVFNFYKVRGKPTPIYALGDKPDAAYAKAYRLEKPAADSKPVIPTEPQSWLAALGL